MTMSSERQIDAAIDRTVREMLDAEPPAGLRGRVLRRIAESDQHAASGFNRQDRSSRKRLILWTTVPLGAAAALVLALLPLRSVERQTTPPSTVASVHTPRTTPPGPTRAVIAPPQRSRATAPTVVATRRPRPDGGADRAIAAAAFAAPDPATDIEPLQSITPIAVAPIAAHHVAPAEISVSPLNPIVEVQVAPLRPSERRN
jgi:hypothetical protein